MSALTRLYPQCISGACCPDPSVRVKVHEPLRLAMAKERLRFFDTKTELAI